MQTKLTIGLVAASAALTALAGAPQTHNSSPVRNADYWTPKLARNVEVDERAVVASGTALAQRSDPHDADPREGGGDRRG